MDDGYYVFTDVITDGVPVGFKMPVWVRIEDANGNAILVSYAKDQGQIYLERIDYTDGHHSVLFTLEDRQIPLPGTIPMRR